MNTTTDMLDLAERINRLNLDALEESNHLRYWTDHLYRAEQLSLSGIYADGITTELAELRTNVRKAHAKYWNTVKCLNGLTRQFYEHQHGIAVASDYDQAELDYNIQ